MSEACPLCSGTLEEVNKKGFNSHKTGAHARLFKDGKMVKVHPMKKCVNCGVRVGYDSYVEVHRNTKLYKDGHEVNIFGERQDYG